MMKLILSLSFLILIFKISQGENKFKFLPESAMLSKDQDGILMVSLNSGENATVCNYGFTDLYANKACGSMGYPMKGITILAKKLHLVKTMKMVSIKCHGTESSLKDCTVITDGRFLRTCRAKSRVAHIFCLKKKLKVIMQKITARTVCDIVHPQIRLIPVPGKLNTGFIQIKESKSHSFRFVCNKYLNFGIIQAQLFCNFLCRNPINPRPIMYMNPGTIISENGYFSDMMCPDGATIFDQCNHVYESKSCDKIFNIALQCGDEVKKEEPRPQVVCSNRSMVIEWSTEQSFYLNASLVSLHPNHTENCLYTKNEKKKNVIIKIPLDYCSPVITDNEDTITFKYTLIRSYDKDGMVQFKIEELIDVYCDIPKHDQISKEYIHGDITFPPVLSSTSLKVIMTLHTAPDFQNLLPEPYDIKFYTPVFVKTTIYNPLSQIKLSLSNCLVTSAKKYEEINAQNSAKIIDESCPVDKYNVQIVPVNKWSIAFQFTAFKLAESPTAVINIFCETMKCVIIEDPDCGLCKNQFLRKKRNANMMFDKMVKAGPITLH